LAEVTSRRPRLLPLLPMALAVATGTALRLWNLGGQVMAGDELHAVRAALARPVSAILFVYQAPDNCIPLTLLDRLVLDAGGRLGEWIVRWPVLASGLGLLVAAPAWAWRRLGPPTAVALAALLAVSPALVFYSRIARPYAPAALFGFTAVAAFDAWLRRPGWRSGLAYVVSSSVALWFHLGAGPLVVMPILVGVVAALRRRGREPVALLLLAVATAAAFLGLLVPARETLLPLAAAKHGRLEILPGEGAEVAALLAGARSPLVWLAFWLLAGIGLVRMGRRDPWLAALAGTALAGQLVGIALLSPAGHQSPVILGRYLMPALPWALVLAAGALGAPWPVRWPRARPIVAAAAVAALLVAGPLLDGELARSSFAHEETYLRFTAPRPGLAAGAVPAIYRWLATAPPGAVLESPWHPVWRISRATEVYQRLHRRSVVVAVAGPVFGDPRLAFRNMAPSRPTGLLASRARWLVVHRDPVGEEEAIMPGAAPPDLRGRLRAVAARHGAVLRAAWGPPDRADGSTWCWDLDRVRRATQAAAPTAQRPAPSPPRAASTASARMPPRVSIVARPSAALAAAGSPK
jgi:hypothetical protein